MTLKKVPGQVPGTRTYPAPPEPPGRRPLLHQRYFFGPVVISTDEVAGTQQMNQVSGHERLPVLPFKQQISDSPIPHELLHISVEGIEEVPKIAFRLEGEYVTIHITAMHKISIICLREKV